MRRCGGARGWGTEGEARAGARSGRGTGARQPHSRDVGSSGGSLEGTRWAGAAEWKEEEGASQRGSTVGGDFPKPPAPGPGRLLGPLQPMGHVPRADGGRPPSLQLNCCGSNTLTTLTTSVLKNSLCPSGGNAITNLFKVRGDSVQLPPLGGSWVVAKPPGAPLGHGHAGPCGGWSWGCSTWGAVVTSEPRVEGALVSRASPVLTVPRGL